MRRITFLVVCILAVCLCAGSAFASGPYPDTMKVDYFLDYGGGEYYATLELTNTGYSGGNICADIFVYDPTEEQTECCSCLLTPNDLRTISVVTDLNSNPLTGNVPSSGNIRIVSAETTGGSCPLPYTGITPVSYTLRAWATHIQTSYDDVLTEAASQDATLSSAELKALQNGCYAIHLDGSGSGQCSCGSGD